MHRTQLRNVALLVGLSVSLSGCSVISSLFSQNAAKKEEAAAAQAREDELAATRAKLAAKREEALDPASTPDQMWDYTAVLSEVYANNLQEELEVDPGWMPELETALSSRIEAGGGLNADNSKLGYALVEIYSNAERYDESANMVLELTKAGGEGPVGVVDMFDGVTRYPRSEGTDAAVLELCPLVRPSVEAGREAAFLSLCLQRVDGELSKLSWEGILDDAELYARSSSAQGPASGTFTFHSRIKGYKKSFWALGTIDNTSAVYLGRALVTAVLLDDADAEVGSFTGYALRDEIPPGTQAPVSILINDPPKHASIRYEFVAEQADYLSEPVRGLRVEAIEPRRGRFGWKAEGKVISESDKSAQFVKVIVQALDAEGKIVGATTTYIDEDKLEAGGTARWHTSSLEVARKPDHFEYIVTARVAD